MMEADIPSLGHQISDLIHEIDARYARNAIQGIEALEACLEGHLERLEAVLCEIEDECEWRPDLEPDPWEGCSIEAQFRSAYAQHISDPLLFFPGEELADHLRCALEEAQIGGMSPSGLKEQDDEELVELARELFWEQRRRIARLLSGPFSLGYAS